MLQQKLQGISEGEPMEVDNAASSSKGFIDQYFRAEYDTSYPSTSFWIFCRQYPLFSVASFHCFFQQQQQQ